jgi:hypothetical protein
MNSKEKVKLFKIRCAGKRWEYVSKEDHRFCAAMFKKYPKEYGEMEVDVFNATVPFGSTVRRQK